MKQKVYPGLEGWMASSGMTRKYLAGELDMSYTALTRRLSGERAFSVNEAIKICEVSGKTFEELFI